ncbi:predicted protein [Streptomyces sp. SPB78]|nr:predicted protein [Streptomyces sp. SPB78]
MCRSGAARRPPSADPRAPPPLRVGSSTRPGERFPRTCHEAVRRACAAAVGEAVKGPMGVGRWLESGGWGLLVPEGARRGMAE